MLEDYSFKYIFRLLSKGIDEEEMYLQEFFDYFETIQKNKQPYILEENSPGKSGGNFEENSFISKTIKQTLRSFTNHYSYSIKYSGFTINLSIHCMNENIELLLKNVLGVVSFMVSMNKNKNKSFGLHLYLTDYKKTIEKGKYTPENINSGSTNREDIIVWRKEDILKVIIHEIIHLMGFDNVHDTAPIIEHYNQKYDLANKKLNVYEAYTEIWALLIHCYYLASVSLSQHITLYQLFSAYVLIEKSWCNELAGKLLTFFRSKEDVDQETNTLSYYIIKTELLNDLKGFLEVCSSPTLTIVSKNNAQFLDHLKNCSKLVKKKTYQKKLSSTMIISSLNLHYAMKK